MTRINTNISSLMAQQSLAHVERATAKRSDPVEHRQADQLGCRRPGRLDCQRGPRRRHHQHPAGRLQQPDGQQMISTADSALGPGRLPADTIQGLVNQSASTGTISATASRRQPVADRLGPGRHQPHCHDHHVPRQEPAGRQPGLHDHPEHATSPPTCRACKSTRPTWAPRARCGV